MQEQRGPPTYAPLPKHAFRAWRPQLQLPAQLPRAAEEERPHAAEHRRPPTNNPSSAGPQARSVGLPVANDTRAGAGKCYCGASAAIPGPSNRHSRRRRHLRRQHLAGCAGCSMSCRVGAATAEREGWEAHGGRQQGRTQSAPSAGGRQRRRSCMPAHSAITHSADCPAEPTHAPSALAAPSPAAEAMGWARAGSRCTRMQADAHRQQFLTVPSAGSSALDNGPAQQAAPHSRSCHIVESALRLRVSQVDAPLGGDSD